MKAKLFLIALIIFEMPLLLFGHVVEPDKNIPAKNAVKRAWNTYCGLYCLYATAKLQGNDIKSSSLIKPEYCGSKYGSTLAELTQAAADFGMYTKPVMKMTSRELRSSPYHIILHVKRIKKTGIMSKNYDHYVLFLGTKNNLARLYDPPNPIRLVPFYELAPRWDGVGLIVSDEPIDTGVIFVSSRKRFVLYTVMAVVLILIVRSIRKHSSLLPKTMSPCQLLGLSFVQSIGFCVMVCLGSLVYHFVHDTGFLSHIDAAAPIIGTHQGGFIPKVDKKKTAQLLKSDTVFIDARRKHDFETGHLEDAINVPVDSNDTERQKLTS